MDGKLGCFRIGKFMKILYRVDSVGEFISDIKYGDLKWMMCSVGKSALTFKSDNLKCDLMKV